MTKHTASYTKALPNAEYIEQIRAAGAKTTKASCGVRVAPSKLVALTETDCAGCTRQYQAYLNAEARKAA